MAARRPQRAKRSPKYDANYYCSLGEDKEGLDVKYINSLKGELWVYYVGLLQKLFLKPIWNCTLGA